MIKYSIVCNVCGKEFDLLDEQEGLSINKRYGHGTKHDGATINLDICCACMERLIEKCAVSPIDTDECKGDAVQDEPSR